MRYSDVLSSDGNFKKDAVDITGKIQLNKIVLNGGSANSSIIVKERGSTGSQICKLSAVIGDTVIFDGPIDVTCEIHADITGDGAEAQIYYE